MERSDRGKKKTIWPDGFLRRRTYSNRAQPQSCFAHCAQAAPEHRSHWPTVSRPSPAENMNRQQANQAQTARAAGRIARSRSPAARAHRRTDLSKASEASASGGSVPVWCWSPSWRPREQAAGGEEVAVVTPHLEDRLVAVSGKGRWPCLKRPMARCDSQAAPGSKSVV